MCAGCRGSIILGGSTIFGGSLILPVFFSIVYCSYAQNASADTIYCGDPSPGPLMWDIHGHLIIAFEYH